MSDFRLLMISAMYENGGNTTHRLLDGHPELFVYPFESQLGTRLVQDHLSSMFPFKYRWPEFRLDGDAAEDYRLIADEEGKIRTRTPHVSKFRDHPMALDDDARGARFAEIVAETGRSRGGNVTAFFRATFDCWTDRVSSGREHVYVGYSPIIAVDAERILSDLPGATVLHVVRNPWSAYGDTKKRPVPLRLEHYLTAWMTVQYSALVAAERFADRVAIVRYEDIVADPLAALTPVLAMIGVGDSDALATPSWNSTRLSQVYPWGTIREPTPSANQATAAELSAEEREEVGIRARPLLDRFDYR